MGAGVDIEQEAIGVETPAKYSPSDEPETTSDWLGRNANPVEPAISAGSGVETPARGLILAENPQALAPELVPDGEA